MAIGLLCGCVPSQHDSEGEDRVENTGQEEDENFRELAEDYERIDRVIWQKPELIIDRMGKLDRKTVADIGAGTGYFAFRIAARGARVIAIDLDPQAITWMNSEEESYSKELQDRFETRLATPNNPNLRPGEADIVLLVNTYIYISDRVAYFRQLKKGMIAGGELYIIDFKKKATVIGPPVEDRLNAEGVEAELIEAGYDIIEVDKESLDYQYIITATPNFDF